MGKCLNVLVLYCSFFSSVATAMSTEKTGFPKWDGIIDLQKAGLPSANACFTKPYSTKSEVEAIVDFFLRKAKSDLVALRPDGIGGVGKTPAGINFKKTDRARIIDKLAQWSAQGYGVTLVETHNRFDYDFCCNVLFGEDGNFVIEFVGPGFDGGDLNKAILRPTMVVRNRIDSPIFLYSDPVSGIENTETLQRLYLRIGINGRAPTEEETNTRLRYIAEKLLPDMGVEIERSIDAAKRWLQENGCARLLAEKNPREVVSIDDLKKIVFSASLYAHYLLRNGERLNAKALTAHKYNGKVVFFGTYDCKKWGRF